MFLENLVVDALDPRALGRFWEAALGTETLTDEPAGFETRLTVPDGPVLDLCFQPVPEPPVEPVRLHLHVRGAAEQQQVVDRLRELGARTVEVSSGETARPVLADPEGNRFCVSEEQAAYGDTGPLAVVALEVVDPDQGTFWSWLTGWVTVDAEGRRGLRHPSGRGPVLELRPERAAKGPGKNRRHLDVRLEPDDDADAVAREIVAHGGRELHFDWGELPWRHFADPSGNEFCVLPSRG
jgi:predicted enzyme related to lactoylglutathione lyase